jgi:circadian clock protein KaiB
MVLRLYVAGLTRPSAIALSNITALCEERLMGRYELEVIDITKYPDRANEDDILAAPTLVKRHPLPVRRMIGDMSNRKRVLAGLGLSPP